MQCWPSKKIGNLACTLFVSFTYTNHAFYEKSSLRITQASIWRMDLTVPSLRLLAVCAAVMLAGTLTFWLAAQRRAKIRYWPWRRKTAGLACVFLRFF
jgi:hypothetical protein